MRKNKNFLIQIGIIFLFSLIPFLWLKPNQAILGHDAGFPLSPWSHFLDRMFVWSHRSGLGTDQTIALGGFFIHGFEGFVSHLGFNLTRVQQITFSAYFFGFGISMFALARTIFPERKKYLPVFAGLLYMLNHFILQAWFIAERTKFTLYIALPLVLTFIIKMHKKQMSPLTAAALSAVVLFFLNGGGFLPLYGGFLISIPLVLILLTLFDRKHFFKTGFSFLFFTIAWVILTFLVSSFWIFPYIRYVSTSFAQEVGNAGGQSGVISWVQAISENSSFYNLFRLQGIQEWYVNPLHPYASTYLNNPVFYFFSHLIPFFAFGALLFASIKEKKMVVLFSALALLSMLFTAGSHPPFGFFYIWMIVHVPGFIAFRTPFYKFAPALWLSYTILIAYSIDVFLADKVKSKLLTTFFAGFFIVVICVYNYPFFLGNFFNYEVGRKTTKVTVPQYVFDYAQWSNSKDFPYKRLLLLPGQNPNTRFEAYTWGYWSLAQIQSLLDNQSYIGNTDYQAKTEEIFIKHLYELIEKNDPSWVDEAKYLFVDAVLLRKDFDYKLKDSETTDPNKIEAFLDHDDRFKKVREFGQWEIYELKNHSTAFSFKNYYYNVNVQNKENFFEATTLPGVNLTADTVLLEQNAPEIMTHRKGVIQIPECVHCLLSNRVLYPIDRNQLVTGGSLFYPSKLQKDSKKLDATKNTHDKLELVSQMTTTRVYELTSQFSRNAPNADRLEGWNALSSNVEKEQKIFQEYMSGVKEYGIAENTFLSTFFENVDQQIEDLQVGLEKVNQVEEARLFEKAVSGLQDIRSQVEKVLWYAKDNETKKYLVSSEEAGTYDIFVKKSTTNMFNQASMVLPDKKLFKNNDTFSNIELTNKENTQLWAKLGSTDLSAGLNKIELKDTDSRALFNTTGNLTFNLDSDHKCEAYPLGQLEKNTYKFNIEAATLKDMKDLYIFVDNEDGTRLPLPFWGRRLILEGQKKTYLSFNHEIVDSGKYVIRFCRLNTANIESQDISLTNTYFERVSSPLLVLFKQENPTATTSSTLSVESSEKNQTDYTLNIKGTGSSLLMFDQRFDPGWTFDSTSILADHQLVHGYANGWIVKKSDEGVSTVHLSYIGQKLYREGWIVSLSSMFGISVYLLFRLLKKKVTK